MIIKNSKVLLYIEPKFKRNDPVIDKLTIKMFNEIKPVISQTYSPFEKIPANWGAIESEKKSNGKNQIIFTPGKISLNHHSCLCGAISSGCSYLLSNGLITNLLCVHYLACHRHEIPKEDLSKVYNLASSEILDEKDSLLLQKLIK